MTVLRTAPLTGAAAPPRARWSFALGFVGGAGALAAAVALPWRVVAAGLAAATAASVSAALIRSWRDVAPTRRRAGRPSAWAALTVERRLFGLLAPHRRQVAAGLGITATMTAVGLAKPWPTKILIDNVLADRPLGGLGTSGALAVAVGLTLVLFVLGGALGLAQNRILHGLTQRIIRDLRADLFRHLARLSLRFHDSRRIGDTAYRVSADTYSIHNVLMGGLVPVTSAVLALGGAFVVMLGLDPVLAVLSLVSVPAAAAISQRYGRRIRRSSELVHERESDVWSQAEQTFAAIRTVQAFGRESYEADRFSGTADSSREAMVRLVTQQTVFGLAVDAVLGVGLAGVTYVAATRALGGALTPGEVLVFLAYAGTLYGPVSELAAVVGELQEASAGAKRVFEVLDEQYPPERPHATAPAERAVGRLLLDGVRFGYNPDHPVLHDVDLDVPPGETLALVGPTGAGKSTIASLILRLYDPDAGRVVLDGTDLRDLPVTWLREQVALVPQDPVLFRATVRENIRYGRLDATDEEVEEAARQANILDELRHDPRGLDAPMGDRGVTLSGGQRQRVAIARAFLKDSPVIVLDEPTSALDAATEALVMEVLWRLFDGRTCMVIAHRLSTVHRADRVVVVDGGQVVEQGTHRQLIRRGGLYRRLHAARFGRRRAGDPGKSGEVPTAVGTMAAELR